jgi:hypothetical protein
MSNGKVINTSDIGVQPQHGAQVVVQLRNLIEKVSQKGHLMFNAIMEVAEGPSAGYTIFAPWMLVSADNPSDSVQWARRTARNLHAFAGPAYEGEDGLDLIPGLSVTKANPDLISAALSNHMRVEIQIKTTPEYGEQVNIKRYIEFVPAEEVEGGFDEVGFKAADFITGAVETPDAVEDADLL